MKRFLRRLIWRAIKPTLRMEWGSLPASKRPYCRIFILGQLACDVRANYYDNRNSIVFEEAEDVKDAR